MVKTIIPSPTPTATPIPHAFGIRFALVGNVTPVNVWTLFDANGYSYNNYALMSSYWPRLYQLSIPDRAFEAMAAGGMPSPVQPEAGFYTAAVPLRSDLKWTDGEPFTADDVAFTVNTVLSFQLGFDWHDFYNPDFIDHAEAVDSHTVKFYFKKTAKCRCLAIWRFAGPDRSKSLLGIENCRFCRVVASTKPSFTGLFADGPGPGDTIEDR